MENLEVALAPLITKIQEQLDPDNRDLKVTVTLVHETVEQLDLAVWLTQQSPETVQELLSVVLPPQQPQPLRNLVAAVLKYSIVQQLDQKPLLVH